jgi:hypothetical protein
MNGTCDCGSGQRAEPQHDGHGIFLCYACPACHARKMARYRPDINERYQAEEPIEPEEY